MPSRILAKDFGDDLLERQLTDVAYLAYPFICKAFCTCGGAEYNPRVIQVGAFGTRPTPTLQQVESILLEYEKAGLLEVWEDDDGIKWCWLTRWFRDNSFKAGSVPKCPRPPSLARLVTLKDWDSGDSKLFANFFRKSKKANGEKLPQVKGQGKAQDQGKVDVEGEEVDDVFAYYKLKIQPKLQDLRKHRMEIGRAIDKFGVERCKQAIDNREHDDFFWQHNAGRGAAWFFGDLTRVERYINMKPAKGKGRADPRFQMADAEGEG